MVKNISENSHPESIDFRSGDSKVQGSDACDLTTSRIFHRKGEEVQGQEPIWKATACTPLQPKMIEVA